MKKTLLLSAALLSAGLVMAQTDSVKVEKTEKADTIRIGGMIIIKKNGDVGNSTTVKKNSEVKWSSGRKRMRNVQTSYLLLDFGFSNFSNKTDFNSADAKDYARTTRAGEAPFTSSDFNLRNFKSTNFNLWFFMQKRNLVKHVVNLKYGLGIETNNYRFENSLSFVKGNRPYVFRDSISFSKNKLALDYVTVPLMLNFNTNPSKNNGLSLSLGISAGYLYSSRNKQKSDERGKQKIKGDFDVKPWKISYVGELGMGPVKLYGSYAPQTVFERGLDIRPYNIGIRLGGWD